MTNALNVVVVELKARRARRLRSDPEITTSLACARCHRGGCSSAYGAKLQRRRGRCVTWLLRFSPGNRSHWPRDKCGCGMLRRGESGRRSAEQKVESILSRALPCSLSPQRNAHFHVETLGHRFCYRYRTAKPRLYLYLTRPMRTPSEGADEVANRRAVMRPNVF